MTPQPLRSLLAVLALAAVLAPVTGAQTIVMNTKKVGFVPLPGPSFTAGLWAFESDTGRRYCLQTHLTNGMYVVDTTDAESPAVVATIPGNFRKVAIFGGYAYATTDSGPTRIIDLSDPAQAAIVGQLTIGAHTLRVDDSNGRLYLNRTSSLYIFDLAANPVAPSLLGIWNGAAHDCRPDGDVCYVNGSGSNTRILDVSNPVQPVQIGALPTGNHSSDLYISPSGQRVLLTCDEFVGGYVNLWDVTDPAQPHWLSDYSTPTNATTSVHNVEVKGAYAYIGYYLDQLRILDLRDPSNPVVVGVWDNNPTNTGFWWDDAWESIPDHDAIYMNQQLDTPAGPKGLYTLDFFPAFGAGSPGSGGVEPEIWWSFGPPSPGNDDFALRLTNAAPNAAAWLAIGTSNAAWGPIPLPLALSGVGAPNATLNVSPDLVLATSTDVAGEASITLPIPPGTAATTLYAQWAVLDAGAPNPFGLAVTKGGELVVQ